MSNNIIVVYQMPILKLDMDTILQNRSPTVADTTIVLKRIIRFNII